jgi:superfamily I DNA/RNA helicase
LIFSHKKIKKNASQYNISIQSELENSSPLLIIAGAGEGKTRVIVSIIAIPIEKVDL